MKKILMIGASLLFVTSLLFAAELKFLGSKDEAKKICDVAMQKIIIGNTEGAFDIIEPYFPIPGNEFAMLEMQTVKQLGMVGQRFGSPVAYEFVSEDDVKGSFVRYIYIEKFENHAIRWIFVFYKPKDMWLLNSFSWDDDIKALFD